MRAPRLAMTCRIAALLVPLGLATPGHAGMRQDLASCTAADGRSSAAACTRVMNSGRLPREQYYIGHFNRGSAYRHSGDLEKALADFNRVVALRPNFARGYQMRALVRYGLGDHTAAREDIDRAIKLDGKSWEHYFARATMERLAGNTDEALADLETANDLRPGQEQVLLLRALVRADQGAVEAARADVNKVVSDGKSDVAAYYARAELAFAEQRYGAARTDLERVLVQKADFAAAHMLMGRIEEAEGDKGAAAGRYRKALAAPVVHFNGMMAHKTARARLDAIEGPGGPAVALNNRDDDAPRRGAGCRRFLPATGAIIEADCDDK